MKVVLFRHAQKGVIPYDDPTLTEDGFRQGEAISQLVQKKILPAPTQAWASPKVRTSQTLQAACESAKIQLQKTELLDLRQPSESTDEFRKRILNLISMLDQISQDSKNEVYFLCTHYDWIEEAMTLINCDKDLNSFEFSHWSPAQFILFEVQDSLWTFLKKGSAHAAKID